MLKCRNVHSATEKATYWSSYGYCAGLCRSTHGTNKKNFMHRVLSVSKRKLQIRRQCAVRCAGPSISVGNQQHINTMRATITWYNSKVFSVHGPFLRASWKTSAKYSQDRELKWMANTSRNSSFENDQFLLARASRRWPQIPNCWGFRALLTSIVTRPLQV